MKYLRTKRQRENLVFGTIVGTLVPLFCIWFISGAFLVSFGEATIMLLKLIVILALMVFFLFIVVGFFVAIGSVVHHWINNGEDE